MVFRDLPAVRGPRDLVRSQTPMPYGDWEEFRDHGGAFRVAGRVPGPRALRNRYRAVARRSGFGGNWSTPNYFRTLGVEPLAGRLFGVEEERAGAASVAVSQRAFWRERFGGTPSAVGRIFRVNGEPVTLIGVAPENFLGASPDALRGGPLDSDHRARRRCAGVGPPARPASHGFRPDRTLEAGANAGPRPKLRSSRSRGGWRWSITIRQGP